MQVIGLNPGGLSGGETNAIMRQFVEQTGVTFPVGRDVEFSYGSYSAGRGISPFPLDVIVDQNGVIVYLSREFDAAAMQTAVEALIQ